MTAMYNKIFTNGRCMIIKNGIIYRITPINERINDTIYFVLHCKPYERGIYFIKWKFFPSLEKAEDAKELKDVMIIGIPMTNKSIRQLKVGSWFIIAFLIKEIV